MKKFKVLFIFFVIVLLGVSLYFLLNQPNRGLYKFTLYLDSEANPYPKETIESHKYTAKIGDQFRVLAFFDGPNSGLMSLEKIKISGDKSILQQDPIVTDSYKVVKTGTVKISTVKRISKKTFDLVSVGANSSPKVPNIFERIQDSIDSVILSDSVTLVVAN